MMEAAFGSKARSCLTISPKSSTKTRLAQCMISPRPQKGSLFFLPAPPPTARFLC